ncbi:MAG TPA: TetR family transcriptional regulator [Usitatibacter sp.]|nr:TetR family transcriptional regulator [Usitatibacter sp.]
MAVRQRAVGAQDKEERRAAILDAAERLFLRQPDRMASVAEVAHAAGVAKGTVYLYFPGKEEMLLALHERHTQGFFERFMRLLGDGPVDFDSIFAVAREHFVAAPGRLALTSWCFAMMDREMPLEAAIAFKLRVGQSVATAGTALEAHFPALAPGAGARLLQHSLSLMIGLYQFIHPNQRFGRALEKSGIKVYMRDFEVEIERALRALWSGTIAPAKPAAMRGRRTPKGATP